MGRSSMMKVPEDGDFWSKNNDPSAPSKMRNDEIESWRDPAISSKVLAIAGLDCDAQFQLGLRYLRDSTLGINPRLAVHWLRKAASKGHAKAQYLMAILSRNGEGCAPSSQNFVEYLRQSAANSQPQALLELGKIHYDGIVVPKDLVRAKQLWKQASALGNLEALKRLARADNNLTLWHKAAKASDPEALYVVAEDVLLRGEPQPQKATQAVAMLRVAAQQKYPEALYLLGEMYRGGLKKGSLNHLVRRDCVKSAQFLACAADLLLCKDKDMKKHRETQDSKLLLFASAADERMLKQLHISRLMNQWSAITKNKKRVFKRVLSRYFRTCKKQVLARWTNSVIADVVAARRVAEKPFSCAQAMQYAFSAWRHICLMRHMKGMLCLARARKERLRRQFVLWNQVAKYQRVAFHILYSRLMEQYVSRVKEMFIINARYRKAEHAMFLIDRIWTRKALQSIHVWYRHTDHMIADERRDEYETEIGNLAQSVHDHQMYSKNLENKINFLTQRLEREKELNRTLDDCQRMKFSSRYDRHKISSYDSKNGGLPSRAPSRSSDVGESHRRSQSAGRFSYQRPTSGSPPLRSPWPILHDDALFTQSLTTPFARSLAQSTQHSINPSPVRSPRVTGLSSSLGACDVTTISQPQFWRNRSPTNTNHFVPRGEHGTTKNMKHHYHHHHHSSTQHLVSSSSAVEQHEHCCPPAKTSTLSTTNMTNTTMASSSNAPSPEGRLFLTSPKLVSTASFGSVPNSRTEQEEQQQHRITRRALARESMMSSSIYLNLEEEKARYRDCGEPEDEKENAARCKRFDSCDFRNYAEEETRNTCETRERTDVLTGGRVLGLTEAQVLGFTGWHEIRTNTNTFTNGGTREEAGRKRDELIMDEEKARCHQRYHSRPNNNKKKELGERRERTKEEEEEDKAGARRREGSGNISTEVRYGEEGRRRVNPGKKNGTDQNRPKEDERRDDAEQQPRSVKERTSGSSSSNRGSMSHDDDDHVGGYTREEEGARRCDRKTNARDVRKEGEGSLDAVFAQALGHKNEREARTEAGGLHHRERGWKENREPGFLAPRGPKKWPGFEETESAVRKLGNGADGGHFYHVDRGAAFMEGSRSESKIEPIFGERAIKSSTERIQALKMPGDTLSLAGSSSRSASAASTTSMSLKAVM